MNETLNNSCSKKSFLKVAATCLAVTALILQNPSTAQAATYNFTQTSWVGGATAGTMVHPTNQSGWNQYSSASGLTVGSALSLSRTYTYSRAITVNHAQVPGTDQANFPILVCANGQGSCNISVSGLNQTGAGAHVQNANGYDIGFFVDSACTTKVAAWEMEKYVASTGEMIAWVNNGTLSHTSDTVFYMCYGNASVSTFQSTARNVWDASYKGVWHLADGSALNPNDSTSNINNGTSTNVTATTGQIDGAGAFSSASIKLGGSTSLKPTSVTIQAWVKPVPGSNSGSSDVIRWDGGSIATYEISWKDSGSTATAFGPTFQARVGSTAYQAFYNVNPVNAAWYQVTATYDETSGLLGLYLNGNRVATSTSGGGVLSYATFGTQALYLGNGGSFSLPFAGSIDEARVSSSVRSANWITTEYNNQSSPSSFYSVGAETPVAVSGSLTSSPYDTGTAQNLMSSISWTEDTNLPSGTGVTVSLRTATSSAALTGSWSAFTDATPGCSKVGGVVTCPASAMPTSLTDGNGDEWFQYKVTLTSSSVSVPTVSAVGLTYVVNAAPQFNPDYPTTAAGGVSASQSASSTDPSLGKVLINYSIKDVDTDSGSNTPGFVTPSFQYNIGGVWTPIPSQYLNTGDLSNKAVSQSGYTQYQAVWDAKSQIPGSFTNAAQVRVTINDNEAANNITTQASVNFTLDTKNPTSTIKLDVSNGLIYATSTDDSVVQYIMSNNASTTPDGANAISGIWQSASSTAVSTTTPWVFNDSNSSSTYPTVYFQSKDLYNNTTSLAVVAPSRPANIIVHDVADPAAGNYREFIAWNVYTATSSAAFSKYQLYRSPDGVNYSLLTTLTDSSINYYLDNTVASTTTYSYKLNIVDADGDVSAYSAVVSDKPDGQGGTDLTPPNISGVQVSQVQATWATITWTTDELSTSAVDYSAGSNQVYGSSNSVPSYVVNHSVTLTGLAPNTTYYFKVRAADIAGNIASDDNAGSGYSFTTTGGPTISAVSAAPSDTGAVITWNTSKSADSYVFYSTSSNLAGTLTAGNAALVATSSDPNLFQHKVTLSGLSAGATYYFYVQSTDSDGNTTTDKNGGSYYNFQTTLDTNPPVISGIAVPLTTATQAAIVWTTDEPASSQVSYGTDSGSYTTTTVLDPTLTISHMVAVSGLTAATKYYFIVKSADASGNLSISDENDFKSTASNDIVYVIGGGGNNSPQTPPDTTPPVISDVAASSSTLSAFGVTITFKTDEDALGMVEYGLDDTYGFSAAHSAFGKDHAIKLAGLRLGTVYHFRAKAYDKSGNEADSKDQTFTTKFLTDELSNVNVDDIYQYQEEIENQIASILPSIVPPFIGKVDISNVTQNSADVSWQTNIKAFSSIQYATDEQYRAGGDNPYPVELGNTNEKVQDHALGLIGLQPNTKYHMRVKAYNLPQAASFSKDMTFTTKAADISAYIAEVKINSFRVSWSTPDPSDSMVEYKNMATGEINRKADDQKKTYHEMVIDNVPPGTTFQVKVTSINGKGNIMTSKQPIKVTTGTDTVPPVITGLKIENTLVPGNSDKVQTLIRWVTDEPATTIVYYEEGSGPVQGDHLANKAGDDHDALTTDHIAVLGSLKAGSIYRIQIESVDAAGNGTISAVKTIVVPRQSESISDIIFKNFEDSFKFLQK